MTLPFSLLGLSAAYVYGNWTLALLLVAIIAGTLVLAYYFMSRKQGFIEVEGNW